MINNIGHLDLNATSISQIISKSIYGGTRVDLTELECFYAKTPSCSASVVTSTDFKVTDDGEITMINTLGDSIQAYISYELNPSNKYRLIFKFNYHPT